MLPASSGVILCRLSTSSPDTTVEIVIAALRDRSDWVGHFSVIEEAHVRMTELPPRESA
ncbi:MAG TPA: hypothetical protein VJB57_10680 [Dehalococcoidia bacterium]|nr:hypothetical protein [Dehalococcoidia bacterium]